HTLKLDEGDKPGKLSGICSILGKHGANIISVTHERNSEATSINGCLLRSEVETRNHDHIRQLTQALTEAGHHVVN
ncbi:MAG: threonine ammonia-lyase, partial [Duncaniella sp.]|nr:threonine ammonia-lyase [Duncaniella sp.]